MTSRIKVLVVLLLLPTVATPVLGYELIPELNGQPMRELIHKYPPKNVVWQPDEAEQIRNAAYALKIFRHYMPKHKFVKDARLLNKKMPEFVVVEMANSWYAMPMKKQLKIAVAMQKACGTARLEIVNSNGNSIGGSWGVGRYPRRYCKQPLPVIIAQLRIRFCSS